MVRAAKPIVPADPPPKQAGTLPRLEIIERKSEILKPSGMQCLGRGYEATINLTQGCPHLCMYCYARGYRNYPGDDRVLLYGNTIEKLRGELVRKRRLPETVFFSSSSDAFGPYRLLQRMTYEAMELLLKEGIRVSFLTKGYIWRRFHYLWRQYPGMVNAQIGLSTLNPRIAHWLEPLAASPRRRLRNIRRLLDSSISLTVRVDPMVPYVTDTPEQMTDLCRMLAGMGVKNLSASYLFVRPGILRNVLAELPGTTLRRRIWDVYQAGVNVPLRGDGCTIRLPAGKYRKAGYQRLQGIASRFGLSVKLCSCKNPDLDLADKCQLTVPAGRLADLSPTPTDRQLGLFEP